MRRWLPLVVYLGLTATATAAALSGDAGHDPARAAVIRTAGDFGIVNSREGMPVFQATGIAPGESASGTIEIGVEGSEAIDLRLSPHDLEDSPGAGGGQLSSSLALSVRDVTEPIAPRILYAGPLTAMAASAAGILAPGETRTYEFTVTLPEQGPGIDQNALQGAATSVAFAWVASEAAGRPTLLPTQPPIQPPVTPPNAPPLPPNADRLELAVTKAGRKLGGGRLVVWAGCDKSCRITARGRLVARGHGHHRATKLRLRGGDGFAEGTQRLRFRVPGPYARWLRTVPGPIRLRARLRLTAVDRAGERATATKTLKLRRAVAPRVR